MCTVILTSCVCGDTICPRPLYAAAQLQPIPYACGAQCALLPIAVGAININELMNINDVHESATIFPRPCKLTFDLKTDVRVTCDVGYLCANFGLSRPLCSQVIPDVCDRQMSDSIIAYCLQLVSNVSFLLQLYSLTRIHCALLSSCVSTDNQINQKTKQTKQAG